MLNLALYQQTRLQPRPLAHRAIADGFLRHEYRRKVALRSSGSSASRTSRSSTR
jgi:hypothetical protein